MQWFIIYINFLMKENISLLYWHNTESKIRFIYLITIGEYKEKNAPYSIRRNKRGTESQHMDTNQWLHLRGSHKQLAMLRHIDLICNTRKDSLPSSHIALVASTGQASPSQVDTQATKLTISQRGTCTHTITTSTM